LIRKIIIVSSSSKLVIKSALDNTILEDIFSSKISIIVTTSIIYKVLMIFFININNIVIINLTLEIFKVINIKKKIFFRI